MENLQQQFLNKENFYLAFKRLNFYLLQSNEWYDSIELAKYEANLETNLFFLKKKLEEGTYSTHQLEPLPFPKKNNSNDTEQLRQYFKVHIEDQLVWIALVNVIGHFLEDRMPFWSYGNRLFKPLWYDDAGKLIRGSFKNNSSNLYRKWNQSWPFYRRHISMTIKTMGLKSSFKKRDLDSEIEKKIYDEEESEKFSNYSYLDPKFWNGRKTKKIYWAGLDFKNFFPSVNPDIVLENIKKYVARDIGKPRDDTDFIFALLDKLMHFPLNTKGWDHNILFDDTIYGLKDSKSFYGIPTGLYVSGFLANVAMLDVDIQLNQYIKNNKKIALFKFVDDQVILSNSKSELLRFLNFYKLTLSKSNIGVEFQNEKTSPKNTFDYNKKGAFVYKKNQNAKDALIDVNFPEPLMTHTLQKMSALNDEDYELLDSEEIDKVVSDLKHFLIADFPDSEMKRETRMAFASMKLCALSKKIIPDFRKLDMNLEENFIIYKSHVKIKKDNKKYKYQLGKAKIKFLNLQLKNEINKVNKKYNEIFQLLEKAVNENPDKLKLWKRIIDFCYNTGFDGLKLTFKSIENSNIHTQGKEYIRAYCLLLIQEKYLLSLNKINTEISPYWEIKTSESFIKNVIKLNLNKEIIDSSKPFLNKSIDNFQVVLQFLKINYNNSSEEIQINREGFESVLWYIINHTNNSKRKDLWLNNIEKINFNNPISWSLLRLFPGDIPEIIIDKIKNINPQIENINDLVIENYEFRDKANGLIYEIFENRFYKLESYSKFYPKIFEILKNKKNTHLPLNIWFNKVITQSENDKWVDIRLFEWSILEVIKQIGNALLEEQTKDTIFYQSKRYLFHPSNYLIPIEWITNEQLTWEKWKKITKKHKIILNDEEFIINDTRYFPAEKQWGNNEISYFFGNHDITLILELSTLMIKLLSKSFIWTNHANKIKFIDQYFSEVSNVLETVPVSSDTKLLLSSIFSKSHIIDFFSNSVFDIENGKTINSIKHFNDEIEDIQKKLKTNHLELLGSLPRQLTVIDIDKLNKSKKLY